MGKKNRVIDPGLQYLQLIKFDRIRGKYGLHDRLIKRFGKEKSMEIMDALQKLERRSSDFYDYKNSNYDLSMALNETFDGDIIRKACNYISENKEYFGGTILEVGCESGSMTGFLALTFPDSKIVSIDRSQAALEIAKQRTATLKVNNVEFRCCSLEDVTDQFDTVFCMRTIQENLDSDSFPYMGEPILYQFACYSELTEAYTEELIKRIVGGGSLCIFERVGHDPLMCGWMMTLNEKLCSYLPDTYKEIICEEVEEKNTFQAFVCQPGTINEVRSIYDLWYKAVGVDPTTTNQLKGWNALVYLNDNAGELVKGIYVIDPADKVPVGRFGVFTDRDEDHMLYYFTAANNDINLYSVGMAQKDEALQRLQEAADLNTKEGFIVEKIDVKEDIVEGSYAQETDRD